MDNTIEIKSFQFAIRIVKLCKHIQDSKREFTLTKQLLRSGTSIGANVAEPPGFYCKAFDCIERGGGNKLLASPAVCNGLSYRKRIFICDC